MEKKPILRPVVAGDEAFLLRLVNDPTTRKNSRHPDLTVSEASHHKWFTDALADTRRVMCIAEIDGVSAGLVRTGPNPCGETELCFTVDSRFRGRDVEPRMVIEFIKHYVPDLRHVLIPVKIGDLVGDEVRQVLEREFRDLACFRHVEPETGVLKWYLTDEVSGNV